MELALHQATVHVLQDFVNVHTHAQVAGQMTAEIRYTMVMTAITTAIGVATIAFGSWAIVKVQNYFGEAALLASKMQLASKVQLAGQFAKQIGRSVVSEMFEEVVIDGLIESLSESIVPMLGGTDDMAFWVSSIVTSVRESLSGTGRMNRQQIQQANNDLRSWIATRQSQEGEIGALSTEIRRKLYNEYKIIQSQMASDNRASMSQYKKLVSSKSFKLLSLAIPSAFFGGFTVIGAIQIAQAFGKGVIASPKAISMYYTGIKQRIAEKRDLQKYPSAAGLSPQQLKTVWDGLMGYTGLATSAISQSNINPRSNAKNSVDAIVNNKLGEIAPNSLEVMSMFGAFGAQAYYASEFEEMITQLDEANSLKSSAVSLQAESSEEVNIMSVKLTTSLEDNLAEMTDPLVRFRGKALKILWAAKEKVTFKNYVEKVRQAIRKEFPALSKDFEFSLYFGGYVLQIGAEITIFEQDGKESKKKISENMDIMELLNGIGYDYSQQALDQEKHVMDAMEVGTPEEYWVTTPFKSDQPSGDIIFRLSENVNDFRKLLLAQIGSYKTIDNILLKKSDLVIEGFIKELNSKVNGIIGKFTSKGSSIKDVFTKQIHELFRKHYLFSGTKLSEKEINWNQEMEKYFERTFLDKIDGISEDITNNLISQCFMSSTLNKLFEYSKISQITDGSKVFDELYKSLLSMKTSTFDNEIFSNSINEFFGLFFTMGNIDKFTGYFPTKGNKQGAFAESHVFLHYLSKVLKQLYLNDKIDPSIAMKEVDVFYFSKAKDDMGSSPFLFDGEDRMRYPDLSNILLHSKEIGQLLILMQPIKYYASRDVKMQDVIADFLSSLYVQSVYNIWDDKSNENFRGFENIKVISSLLNLLSKESDLNDFLELFLKTLSDFDIYHIRDSKGNQKISRRIMPEDIIIKHVNEKIWSVVGNTNPTAQQYKTTLKILAEDRNFIVDEIIKPNAKDKLLKYYQVNYIQDFLKKLSELPNTEFNLQYSEWTDIISGDIVRKSGFDRTSDMNYYFKTENNPDLSDVVQVSPEKFYKFGGLEFQDIIVLEGSNLVPIKSIENIESKSFRIVHNINGKLALAEVSSCSFIKNPADWYDGLIFNGKLVRNAIITDHSGTLISSTFYDSSMGVSGQFMYRSKDNLNKDIIENGLLNDGEEDYGLNILFAFSRSDSNKQINTLLDVDLFNPAYRSDSLHYDLPAVGTNFFDNLDKSEFYSFLSMTSLMGLGSDSAITFEPMTGKLDPNIISKEDLFNLYMKVFDIRNILGTESQGSKKRAYPSALLRGLIGSLNLAFNPETGEVDSNTYRNIATIESIITKLFTEIDAEGKTILKNDDLKKFLFLKDKDGKTIPMKLKEEGEDFSLKKWFDLVVSKIKNYDAASDSSEVGALIAEAQGLLGNYKDFTFNLGNKKFSRGEARSAKVIFEVISRLFGHMTLRLTFMHMIDYYTHGPVGHENKFKIDFYSILSLEKIRDYLNDFNIITSSQNSHNMPLTSDTSVASHLFSLFFTDSYVRLPVESFRDRESVPLFFGYSPLSFVDSSFTTENQLEFNREIQNNFFYQYLNSKAVKDAVSLRNSVALKIKLFKQSSGEILEVLKSKIEVFVRNCFKSEENKDIAKKKRTSLLNKLLMAAEKGALSLSENEYVDGVKGDSIRIKIENLIIGGLSHSEGGKYYGRTENAYSKTITFNKVSYNGRPVKISINKDDFNGKDIIIWRSFSHLGKEMTSLFDFYLHNIQVIRSKSSALKEIIKDNVGEEGKVATDGKVRIYVAQNHLEKGYHLLATNAEPYIKSIPRRERLATPYSGFSFDANRFDLDLSDPDIDSKIEYIIALSLCYEKVSHTDNMFFMTRDEITKEVAGTYVEVPIWFYDSVICAFDRHRFYSLDEIFSKDSITGFKAFTFSRIEEGAILKQEHVKEWIKFDLFIPTFYDGIPLQRWW